MCKLKLVAYLVTQMTRDILQKLFTTTVGISCCTISYKLLLKSLLYVGFSLCTYAQSAFVDKVLLCTLYRSIFCQFCAIYNIILHINLKIFKLC